MPLARLILKGVTHEDSILEMSLDRVPEPLPQPVEKDSNFLEYNNAIYDEGYLNFDGHSWTWDLTVIQNRRLRHAELSAPVPGYIQIARAFEQLDRVASDTGDTSESDGDNHGAEEPQTVEQYVRDLPGVREVHDLRKDKMSESAAVTVMDGRAFMLTAKRGTVRDAEWVKPNIHQQFVLLGRHAGEVFLYPAQRVVTGFTVDVTEIEFPTSQVNGRFPGTKDGSLQLFDKWSGYDFFSRSTEDVDAIRLLKRATQGYAVGTAHPYGTRLLPLSVNIGGWGLRRSVGKVFLDDSALVHESQLQYEHPTAQSYQVDLLQTNEKKLLVIANHVLTRQDTQGGSMFGLSNDAITVSDPEGKPVAVLGRDHVWASRNWLFFIYLMIAEGNAIETQDDAVSVAGHTVYRRVDVPDTTIQDQELAAVRAELRAQTALLEQVRRDKDDAISQLNSCRDENRASQTTLRSLRDEVARLTADNQRLSAALQHANDPEKAARIGSLERENATLKGELESERSEKRDVQAELLTTKADLVRQTTDSQAAKNQVATLTTDLAALREELDELRREKTSCEVNLSESRRRLRDMQERVDELQRQRSAEHNNSGASTPAGSTSGSSSIGGLAVLGVTGLAAAYLVGMRRERDRPASSSEHDASAVSIPVEGHFFLRDEVTDDHAG